MSGPTFDIGEWRVDAGCNLLINGERRISVEHKVMEVLEYLAIRQGEVVSRDQLERAVWGETVVGYDALTRIIAKLRKALDDDSRQPRFIETISKKGYRLVAPVTFVAPQQDLGAAKDLRPSRLPVQGSWRLVAWTATGLLVAALALVTALHWLRTAQPLPSSPPVAGVLPQTSIAILPFADLGNGPKFTYFAQGMTVDLTTLLSKFSGLFVIAPFTTQGFSATAGDVGEVKRSLGVRYVVTGTVQRQANRVRVNVQLTDGTNDLVLWADRFDGPLGDVFTMQDEIIKRIASVLEVRISADERRRTAKRYTSDIAAYDDFLQGQWLYLRHNQESNRTARRYFEKAIARDPTFARAYSAAALTYVAQYRHGWSSSEATDLLARARRAAKRAVDIDDQVPQSLWALAYVDVFQRRYDEAEALARKAAAVDPNFADTYLTMAICALQRGQPNEALTLVRKAISLNPKYPAAYASILGQAYYASGRYALAAEALSDALQRNANLQTANVFLLAALRASGDDDEATWAAMQFRENHPDFRTDALAELLPIGDAHVVADLATQLHALGFN